MITTQATYKAKTVLKHFTKLCLCCVLLSLMCACDRNHDGNLDDSYETQLVDLVTYMGVDSDDHALFRLEGHDDEGSIDLYTSVGPVKNLKENHRVLLRYSIENKGAAAWNITPLSVSKIISDSIRVNINPLDTYEMHPIKLMSAWRTGEFINMHGQVEFTGKSRHFYMMIDRETRGNDTVQAYLVHDLLDTPQDSIFYWRDFYLSVNVGVLKSDKDPCNTIRLHFNDVNNPEVNFQDFKIK